ncbi:MAG: L-threonylcarbamoyladenylate synthase [Candidatus Aminicenantes bacterium]
MAKKTEIIKVNLHDVEKEKITRIVKVLRQGGLIIYPTETFYGLGVNCFIKESIQRIYGLKKRDYSKPISLVVSDMEMVETVAVDIPDVFRTLAGEFWPGPLTLILKASPRLPRELRGEGSAAVRIPDLFWLQELIKEAGFPLTATSANLSGEKEIYRPEEITANFYGKVDLIVDGGRTPGVRPSTVVDLTAEKPKIIREGIISRSALKNYITSL